MITISEDDAKVIVDDLLKSEKSTRWYLDNIPVPDIVRVKLENEINRLRLMAEKIAAQMESNQPIQEVKR